MINTGKLRFTRGTQKIFSLSWPPAEWDKRNGHLRTKRNCDLGFMFVNIQSNKPVQRTAFSCC